MLNDFKEVLGDGIEVVTGTSSDEEIQLGNQWAGRYNLLASCGSDFHGWPNQRVQIGNLRDLPDPEKSYLEIPIMSAVISIHPENPQSRLIKRLLKFWKVVG